MNLSNLYQTLEELEITSRGIETLDADESAGYARILIRRYVEQSRILHGARLIWVDPRLGYANCHECGMTDSRSYPALAADDPHGNHCDSCYGITHSVACEGCAELARALEVAS